MRVLSAISLTGAWWVAVKYSVRRLTPWARIRPMTTAPKQRQPTLVIVTASSLPNASVGLPTYRSARAPTPTTVMMPAVRKPRLIGFRASVSPSLAFTAYTPKMEAMTPMARAASGNTRPRAGFRPAAAKAGTPRMMAATRVTS